MGQQSSTCTAPPKVENARAELVLSDIRAMHPLDSVMTPSQKPLRARMTSANL
jgi:hypothetical protein